MTVFLSHASVDEQLADQVREGLERRGIKVWSDQLIEPGDAWSGSIESALRNADSFIFLLGSHSMLGPWTSLELGKALASGKRVIPVLAEHDAEVPAVLQSYQYLDLSDPAGREQGIGRLSHVLETTPTGQSAAEGIRLVEEATAHMGEVRAAEAKALEGKLVTMVRAQVAVAAVSVLATAGVLLAVAGTANSVVVSIVGGVLTVLAWAAGFYRGQSEGETTDE